MRDLQRKNSCHAGFRGTVVGSVWAALPCSGVQLLLGKEEMQTKTGPGCQISFSMPARDV